MNSFDDRQKAFEDKYVRDQDLQFRVMARRNKLLGIWAGGKLGKSGPALDEYAKTVLMSDFAEPGDDDVLRAVLANLTEGGVAITREQLRHEMDALMKVAMDQIMKEA